MRRGIQHFYFKDYTADYVASTSFDLVGGSAGASLVGMKNFFTAQTTTPVADVRCFVHPEDAVVLSAAAQAGPYRFEAQLRKEIKTDMLAAHLAPDHRPGGDGSLVERNGSGGRS